MVAIPVAGKSAGKAAQDRRTRMRQEFFPHEQAQGLWTARKTVGWFFAPRSLPMVLTVLKKISGEKGDPTSVYLELYSRHIGEGIIEMGPQEDHAYASGYTGNRGTRTWRDRMKMLEDLGFIKVQRKGTRAHGYVVLIHPALAMERLNAAGKIPPDLWQAYRSRQMEAGEPSAAEIQKRLEESPAKTEK